MRILHTLAGGQAGGAEMAYVDLLIAQHARGMDVIAACRPNSQRVPLLREAGVTVYELPFGGIFDFKTTSALKKIIAEEEITHVQCWMSRASKLAPKIDGVHKIARLGGYYNLKYYRDVDHFIGNTPDICRWLNEDQGIDKSKITHINNFAELESIKQPLHKSDFDTREDQFTFLAMARLHKVKGIDTALHALAKVPDAILWIAGEGPEEKALKKLSYDLGLTSRVRWLGWRTDRSALFDICDSVLFPSRFEPFGGTFIQAWAAKRPLVTTASEGPSQYVTHEKNALVSPINDTDALATNMQRVIDDKFMARGLIREGYDEFHKQFTKSNILNHYMDLYSSLNLLT